MYIYCLSGFYLKIVECIIQDEKQRLFSKFECISIMPDGIYFILYIYSEAPVIQKAWD